jgi:hypothetical protein
LCPPCIVMAGNHLGCPYLNRSLLGRGAPRLTYSHTGRFLEDVYMHKRIHSSSGYLTPVEFEVQWRTDQT